MVLTSCTTLSSARAFGGLVKQPGKIQDFSVPSLTVDRSQLSLPNPVQVKKAHN